MLNLSLKEDIRSLTDFRSNTAAFLQQVRDKKRPLVITQHGRSAAVLLDVSEYEALLEKLNLLTDVYLAEQEIKQSKFVSHQAARDNVFNEIQK
ncbi:MAG: type II toxin-antitoxin system Phd/YefM family antitoxin [Gammaproteobacteria bacterium]|nr:type II toxin-antitoxin system Phd/YefM family antitoxin [Gammaproteobacteria bacterium]